MSQSISAAFHIQGPTIRYAGILREDKALDLQRLGHQTFEFDVARALWEEEGGPNALDRVEEAAREAFDGLTPSSLRVIVSPLDVFSFFMPVAADLSKQARKRHATHQTALVTGARSPDTLHIALQSVRTTEEEGEAMEWVHVQAMPQSTAERMDALVASLPGSDAARMVSSEAAARLVGRVESSGFASTSGPYTLAMGLYPTYTEYALTYDRAWHHAHAAQEAQSLENRVYYAVGFLNRIGIRPSEIGRLFVYGPNADPVSDDPFETVFGCRPVLLDPFDVLRRTSERPLEESPPLYVPCIGGALETPSS